MFEVSLLVMRAALAGTLVYVPVFYPEIMMSEHGAWVDEAVAF